MTQCTYLACTLGCASDRGFLLKSFGTKRISAHFFEICTSKRRSEKDYLHKPDLYDYCLGKLVHVQVHERDWYGHLGVFLLV